MSKLIDLPFNGMHFSNSFVNQLKADEEQNNHCRQVNDAFYSWTNPTPVSKPKLIAYTKSIANELGLSQQTVQSSNFVDIFGGNAIHKDMKPYSTCYGGHQFGNWAGQLGDGRAISLCELSKQNKRYELQLKGAGPTPYSRMGDGRAVLRSSIREFLCSEAMHGLGVPTTRALSLLETGDPIMRDMFYDGNARMEPGAIVCRVAPSFIRFGHFELFMARRQPERIMELVDYVVTHHLTFIKSHGKERVVSFFHWVCKQTALMISQWMTFGFVHGVMNTDNMSILGLTIDYGPYGWLDNYDASWTPNTTDAIGKRYCYGNQPQIAMWNLLKLADALYPLLQETEALQTGIEHYAQTYESEFNRQRAFKLGLLEIKGRAGDKDNPPTQDRWLLYKLYELMEKIETDMTIFYRRLTDMQAQFEGYNSEKEHSIIQALNDSFYHPLNTETQELLSNWLQAYASRLSMDARPPSERIADMNTVNPHFILRNWIVQTAIEKAEKGDFSTVYQLQECIKNPFNPSESPLEWLQKRPEWARHKAGCSMLSCSS